MRSTEVAEPIPVNSPMPVPILREKRAIEEFFANPGGPSLSRAFDRKFTVHAGLAAPGVTTPEIAARYEEVLSQKTARGLALYLHFPFCGNQCLYCGFAGRRPEAESLEAYTRALLAEIAWLRERAAARGVVAAVYLGGGTPTVFAPEQLQRVMAALRDGFQLANDCEITLEGRLHDFTEEKTKGFLEAGFNRFSIGVQSFDTRIRQSLGRLSDRAKVTDYLGRLTAGRRAAIIIDLMYGLPGQTPDAFTRDLESAEALGVDGLDVYQLNIFPGSRLERALREGRLPAAARLSEQGEFYRRAGEHLLGRRWRQLSLSHFAFSPRERNLYNPWSKRRADCLALGAGAGGFLSGWSFYRKPRIEPYLSRAAEGIFVPDVLSPPMPGAQAASFIVGQMEQGYLHHRRLVDEFQLEAGPLKKLMDNWNESGLIALDGEWLTMTVSGRFWGVNLTQAVVEIIYSSMKED